MCTLVKHDIDTLRVAARQYVGPFSWFSDDTDANSYRGNGSFFIINSGDKYFGVTAAHVLKDCEEQTPMGFKPRLANHIYDVFGNIISRSQQHDVATFHLDVADVSAIGLTPLKFPILVPQEGRGVFVLGYLASANRIVSDKEIEWCQLANALVATHVRNDIIEVHIDVAQIERHSEDWISLTNAPRGLSGSPMLTVVNDTDNPLTLGGMTANFVPIDHNRGYFIARRLDKILNFDGTVSA